MKTELLILAASLVLASACGGDDVSATDDDDGATSAGGAGGATSSTATASSGSGGGATAASSSSTGGAGGLTYTGTVIDALSMGGVPGAEICISMPDLGCVTADAQGAFTFPGIPASTRIRVRASANGYVPSEGLVDTGTEDSTTGGVLFSSGLVSLAFTLSGITWDSSKPAVAVLVQDAAGAALAGYSVSIAPASGDGPYYPVGTGIPANGTATGDRGAAIFINLDAGDYTVTVTGPSACTSAVASDPNTAPAPVADPAMFAAVFECE